MTINEILSRAVDQILPSKEGLKKLMQKKKIRLYIGIDPTATQLHLGHTVMLRKLQQFASLGHEAILLFGTGTVLVGDPSLKNRARKLITEKEIERNIATWKDQVKSIIDFNKVKIKHNGDWLLKLTLKDIIKIGSQISAVQLFKRDMFERRLKQGDTIWYHETMYPLLQGYDSVVMNVDLEIGGTDQTFNMLIGRELQQKMNQKEKFVLAGKMIPGTDGKPMSKTSANCIWLTDTANDMFGKLMKTQDQLMPDYLEFFTDKPIEEIKKLEQSLKSGKTHPMEVKKQLAFDITSQFHGQKKAQAAQAHFEKTFQKREPEYKTAIAPQPTLAATISKTVGSTSEAKRLIKQGAVDISGATVHDPTRKIRGGERIKIGKRTFVKVKKK